MRKPITKLLFLAAAVLAAALSPGINAQAKEKTDIGTLSSKGDIELRWTEEEAHNSEFASIGFKAKKDGYITFTANNVPENSHSFSGDWKLCNSSGKQLSGTVNSYFRIQDDITFAIKKNTKYSFMVSLSGYNDAVIISYRYKAVTDKSGNKKSKAYSLKKNKTMSGLLMTGETKADWYKIKLTKPQVLKLTFTTKSTNGICIEVYNSKGKNVPGLDYHQTQSRDETVSLSSKKSHGSDTNQKQPKGTYYVKIYGMKGWQQSGFYSLKWK